MPTVEAIRTVPGVSAESLWRLFGDGERLTALATDVLAVQPAGDGESVWTVLLSGSQVTWTQRETASPPWDLRFHQVSGDFAELSGHWSVSDTRDGPRLSLQIDFQLGVGGLVHLLDPIWCQAFQSYANSVVGAVAAAAATCGKSGGSATGGDDVHVPAPERPATGHETPGQLPEYLNFLSTTVAFHVDAAAATAFTPVREFFRHLMSGQPANRPTFTVSVERYDPEADVDPAVWRTGAAVIRRSSTPEFCFDAHVVVAGGRRRYVNRATMLDTPLDARADGSFTVRITEGSTIQVIDFLRDLVIRNEESLGTVMLHAAGVYQDDAAIAIAGPKGAGKTTTLLSALSRGRWRYFTGDKMFCRIEHGVVRVYPWRDWPYVGAGTIIASPALAELVRETAAPDLDQLPASRKILLDPGVFERWLGIEFSAEPRELSAILLPEVRPGEPLRLRHLTDRNERRAHLIRASDRQADTTFFTWQTYLVPDYSQFYASLARLCASVDGTPMVRLRGTLDVDPAAVLADWTQARSELADPPGGACPAVATTADEPGWRQVA